jgi:hypothetical protein
MKTKVSRKPLLRSQRVMAGINEGTLVSLWGGLIRSNQITGRNNKR